MNTLCFALLTAAAIGVPAAGLAQSPPARDSRGYEVISNPAQAPAGVNQPVNAPPGTVVVPPDQPHVFTPRPSEGNCPPCTREVTDNCMQVHERQRARK